MLSVGKRDLFPLTMFATPKNASTQARSLMHTAERSGPSVARRLSLDLVHNATQI
jgi:hypothetical protein